MQKKEKWIITALGFFSLCLAVAGIIVSQRRVTENTISVMSSNNWGLSFQEEGKAPVIDVDKDMLKELDAYYLGDEEEKKIYLTFDAGYENGNTEKILDALKENDVETFGKLMNASHVSLRDDYEVSCEEIDVLVDLAWGIEGVVGSRITGGGFGGCTVSIVKNEAVDTFVKVINEKYLEKVGHKPEIYVVDIGDGAGKLD